MTSMTDQKRRARSISTLARPSGNRSRQIARKRGLPLGALWQQKSNGRWYWRGTPPEAYWRDRPGEKRRRKTIPLVVPGEKLATRDGAAARHLALQKIAAWQDGDAGRRDGPPATMADWVEGTVRSMRRSGPQHRRYVRDICMRFIRHADIRTPMDITASKIDGFLADMERAGRRPSTVHAYHAALSKLCGYLYREDAHYQNVTQRVERPVVPEVPPKPPDRKALARLLRLARAERRQYVDPILVGRECGLRLGEIAALRCSHLQSFMDQPVLIVEGADGKGTKSGSWRRVPVPAPLVRRLRRIVAARTGGGECVADPLLFGRRGLRNWSRDLRKLTYDKRTGTVRVRGFGGESVAGKKGQWHALRAYCATAKAAGTWRPGVPGYTVWQLMAEMGWASPRMATHYVKLAGTGRAS